MSVDVLPTSLYIVEDSKLVRSWVLSRDTGLS